MTGPKAPQDPVKKRSAIYLMLDAKIEATARGEGSPSQEIYLAGEQLKNKARLTGGVTDEDMLALLGGCDGFRRLVHGIGVSVKADDPAAGPVRFAMQNWGKTSMYESGTVIRVPCAADGTETIVELADQAWSDDDDVPGKFAFEFGAAGETATATVKLYLNDGYEVPELETEPPVAFGSEAYRAMIAKSLLARGNNRRLKAAIDKARRGEDVTIAYIGGSITQGAGAKPIHTNCYAYQSYVRFKDMFGRGDGENVHFVKAGVGGTPSELGMIRYERDVLKDGAVQPDVVVVEFAVNDAGDETNGACYESLCLKILEAPNKPAVVLLFSVFVNDWNLQDRLAPVGLHYGLPMVSVKDAVEGQFRLTKAEGNVISKRQFFYDIYHPTDDGHTVMADCLAHLFAETAEAAEDADDIVTAKPPAIGNDFKGVRLLDRKTNTDAAAIAAGGFAETDADLQNVEMDGNPHGTPQFPHNWMHAETSGAEPFKLTIDCRNLVLVYKDSGSAAFGKADVFVDGEHVKTEDPHVNNWTHCNVVLLVREDECRTHTVEIRMAPGDERKRFTILGFGYTR